MDTSVSLWPGARLLAAALILTGAAACAPRPDVDSAGTGDTAGYTPGTEDTAVTSREAAAANESAPGDTAAPEAGSEAAPGEESATPGAAGRRDAGTDADTPTTAAAATDTVEGIVRQVGNVPFVMTVVQGTDTVAVTGPYEDELTRAAGIRVRIIGRPVEGRHPGPALEVSEYRLLSVSGATPHVGWLRRDGEGYYLEGRDREIYRLGPTPSSLRERLGARVWVVTSAAGAVQQYGILRAAEAGSGAGG